MLTRALRSLGTRTAAPSPWEKRSSSCLVGKLRLGTQLCGEPELLPQAWDRAVSLGGRGSGGWCICWCEGLAPHPPTAGTHTLQLARAQPSDSGIYMCEALNAAGRDQKLVQLSVLGTSCLYPPLHCPLPLHSAPQPHSPQAAQPREAPGEPGCPTPSRSYGVQAVWWPMSWSIELDALGFETQLCTSLLCDL